MRGQSVIYGKARGSVDDLVNPGREGVENGPAVGFQVVMCTAREWVGTCLRDGDD